jgi:hypothetical protein
MSDRPLRRLVAKLSTVRQEDMEAVLAQLEAGQRKRVATMLAELAGIPVEPAKPQLDLRGLSLWLVARLTTAAGGKAEGEQRLQGRRATAFSLTKATRQALLEAAALHQPKDEPSRQFRPRFAGRLRRAARNPAPAS